MDRPREYQDGELDAMLSDLESDLVERKESFRLLAENGNPPPEFQVTSSTVTATVRPAA